jgi:hypothetical protein
LILLLDPGVRREDERFKLKNVATAKVGAQILIQRKVYKIIKLILERAVRRENGYLL